MRFPFEIPTGREFDVVGFGTNAVDFLIQVPEYPSFNSKIELTQYIRAAGGEVASTMAGLNRLGCRTSYVGRFGSDEAGLFGMQSLADESVDLRFAERIDGALTQIAFIVIDERSGERTVIWQRDAKLSYSGTEAPLPAVESTRVLHCTPHDAAACIALAQRAKELGAIVSTDIDNVFPGISELVPYVDVLIASAEFPQKFLGITDRKTALRELHSRFGCRVVGITIGALGSLLYVDGSYIETPAFAVPGGCKDTTGAGDAFRVGLIFGLLNNSSVEEAARMANGVAALKCRKLGARTALPSAAELNKLLSA